MGKSDVYDGTQAILNRSLIPGSRGNGKDNDREGNCARRNGRKEKQISQTAGINPEKVVIIKLKRSLEVGAGVIIEISGGSGRVRLLCGGKC